MATAHVWFNSSGILKEIRQNQKLRWFISWLIIYSTIPGKSSPRLKFQKQGENHGRTADALRYVLPSIKNWQPFCSEQLQRQIINQNARIFKRN